MALAEQVIEDLLKPRYVNDIGIGVSASAGIALTDVPGAVNTHLMQAAEIALHRQGPNGCCSTRRCLTLPRRMAIDGDLVGMVRM